MALVMGDLDGLDGTVQALAGFPAARLCVALVMGDLDGLDGTVQALAGFPAARLCVALVGERRLGEESVEGH